MEKNSLSFNGQTLADAPIDPATNVYITPEPKLAPIPIDYPELSSDYVIAEPFHFDASLTYQPNGRLMDPVKISGTASTRPWFIDFNGLVMGGLLNYTCTIRFQNILTNETFTKSFNSFINIIGQNPSKTDVKNAIGSDDLVKQAMAFHESGLTFHQFLMQTQYGGTPVLGPTYKKPPKSYGGYGIMQLDNGLPGTPDGLPTIAQMWNWRENIEGGKALLVQKTKEIKKYYENRRNEHHPPLPDLTDDQYQMAIIQYYNGGVYYKWDDTAKKWAHPASTKEAYADTIMGIVNQVKARKFPKGWNDPT